MKQDALLILVIAYSFGGLDALGLVASGMFIVSFLLSVYEVYKCSTSK
jgi:hypothetical protein